jgi:hypothetical protein
VCEQLLPLGRQILSAKGQNDHWKFYFFTSSTNFMKSFEELSLHSAPHKPAV